MTHDRIEINPATMLGKPVIKGTRITVEHICLAAFGAFASEVTAAIDATFLETTENYEGCGCLKVEK